MKHWLHVRFSRLFLSILRWQHRPICTVTNRDILNATVTTCAANKQLPPPGWTPTKDSVNEVFSPTTRELKPGALPGSWSSEPSNSPHLDLGAKHHIGNPIQIYPLYENGFRASRGQSVIDNHKESAEVKQSAMFDLCFCRSDNSLIALRRLRESRRAQSLRVELW